MDTMTDKNGNALIAGLWYVDPDPEAYDQGFYKAVADDDGEIVLVSEDLETTLFGRTCAEHARYMIPQ